MSAGSPSALDAVAARAKSGAAMQRLQDALIVPAGPSDAWDLARVHVTSWRETYDGLLPKAYLDAMSIVVHAHRWRHQLSRLGPGEVVMAAEDRGGLIGYCAAGLSKPQGGAAAEVFTLYLLKAVQGRGLGRRLLASTARVLAAKGAVSLGLWVLNGNQRARDFYRQLGGRPAEERGVSGWGGGLKETFYRWPDIHKVTG
jgi:GNAT superfamily N-acetyltransferase